jgi:hypothetical protein
MAVTGVKMNTTDVDNDTLIEQHFQKRYGLWVHPHWRQYSNIMDSASDLLFSWIGAFIIMTCVAGAFASCTVIFITIT